ncbi:MAG: class I SAM-dependent methyltransferase [Candidatus Eisenbacteria bacterium]|nr:class I SAM-dependent methyltransferase [Candidatus Eisenbacteria bacterium]
MSDLALPTAPSTAAELYLDLLKRVLTRALFPEHLHRVEYPRGDARRTLFAPLQRMLASRDMAVVRRSAQDSALRETGRDWPADAESMIGLRRMENLQACVTDVLNRGVPGDLIETGVWRGGAVIFMRAILKAYGDESRAVWVADSFEGLPKPDARYAADAGDRFHAFDTLAVSLEQVRENFRRYGLLDSRVKFLKGWFKDTLPAAPVERLAVARLDGDMYESTMDALRALYPKLSVGGYLIVDDFGTVPGCRKAVEDYRAEHRISEPIADIDGWGAYWRRER